MRTQNFSFEVLTNGDVKIQNNHTDDYTITDRSELISIYRIIGKILFQEGDTNVCELADRLFELLDPWDRPYDDDDETKAEIRETIENDPKAIINDLLERLEDLI